MDPKAPVEGSASSQNNPPRARAPFLASLAISSFAAFSRNNSQPAPPVAVQSPVKRKPLPPDSPVVAAELNSGPKRAGDKDSNNPNRPSQDPRRVDAAFSPTPSDDGLGIFLPRNLDESVTQRSTYHQSLTYQLQEPAWQDASNRQRTGPPLQSPKIEA